MAGGAAKKSRTSANAADEQRLEQQRAIVALAQDSRYTRLSADFTIDMYEGMSAAAKTISI